MDNSHSSSKADYPLLSFGTMIDSVGINLSKIICL
nr:MAG TPA: hypothetical protein [Caudoviricetes sp.]